MEKINISSLVASQLPDFVRSDYPTFVTFLEKYFEWTETVGKVQYGIGQIQNAKDIDTSDSAYIEEIRKEMLPYFPSSIVADKRLFIKLITKLYRSNGTQDSVKFLFRALYNENIDIYYPKDDILKASDGKWVLPLALRIDTTDNNIFNIENTLLTGSISKATAIVEKVIRSVDRQLGISYIEVYVSNVKRLFTTGETVTSTYNNGITDITVSGRLIGALSEIKIDPNNRGNFYVEGYPLTIVGGLNPTAESPVGALAYVGTTTKGSITDVQVLNGGFGFRRYDSSVPYSGDTHIVDFKGGFLNENLSAINEAEGRITLIDSTVSRTMNLTSTTIDQLEGAFSNIAHWSNIVGTLVSTDSEDSNSKTIKLSTDYQSFNVYPMSYITLTESGGGYLSTLEVPKPTVDVYSFWNESDEDLLVIPTAVVLQDTNNIVDESQDLTLTFEEGDYVRLKDSEGKFDEVYVLSGATSNTLFFQSNFQNDLTGVSVYKIMRSDLYKIGSIGRIIVDVPGDGYAVGDTIIFTNGTGYGANAYVSEIDGTGGIVKVTVNAHSSGAYVIGGEGYSRNGLPTLSVNTVSGANASIRVSEVAGDGESLDILTSRIGAVSSIKVVSYGYDYVEAPKISLRNMDLTLANVTEGQLFISNTFVYQGASNTNTTFKAIVDTFDNANKTIRLFDYSGTVDNTVALKYDSDTQVGAITANVITIKIYGDGTAKANAKFENGLIRYPGIYLNTDGQISADKKLQDGDKYHNFSYIIKTQTDYQTFKTPFNDLVHPLGTKTFVTRMDNHPVDVSVSNTTTIIDISTMEDTFNIATNSNTIISTNTSANLISQVNVGDIIVVSSVSRRLSNTVNVVSGSNILFGSANSVNFINDLIDGDTIYLSTGNTVTVKEVTNSTYAILSTKIYVTSTSATLNVISDEVVTAKSITANTVQVDKTFMANGTYLTATIQKVR